MMQPEWKAKWLDALKSGEYLQGRGRLCVGGQYCCLGVLAEIMGALRPDPCRPRAKVTLEGNLGYLDGATLDKARLPVSEQNSLAILNDISSDFLPTIEYIEKNL